MGESITGGNSATTSTAFRRKSLLGTRAIVLVPLFMLLLLLLLGLPQAARAATSVSLGSSGRTETTVTLTWSQSGDLLFSSYTVYMSSAGSNGPWSDIWSTTSKSQISTYVYDLSPSTNYWFIVVDSDWFGSADSNTLSVTTANNPLLQIISTTTTTASLSWADYNTYSSLIPFYSYTVQIGSSSMGPWSALTTIYSPSQTTYTATGLSPGQTYFFTVYDSVGSSGGYQSYSNSVAFSPLTVTVSASETTADVGQSLGISSSVLGGTGPYGYQWYSNSNPVAGATSPTLMFSPSSPGSYIVYVTVRDSTGAQASSNSITIVVNPQVAVTISTPTVTLSLGQQVQFTSSVSGGTSPYTYQWYSNGGSLSGATSSTFTFAPTSTGAYNVYVTVKDYVGATANSNSIQITVTLTPTNLALIAPTTAHIGDSIGISAKLTYGSGTPLPGQTITFSIGGTTIGNSMTDSSGTASLTYPVSLVAGSYTIMARFAGTPTYDASSATEALVVQPFYLTIATTVPNAQIVSVNNTAYSTDASGNARIPIDNQGAYDVAIVSPYNTGPGVRVIFTNWSDSSTNNPRVVVMNSDQGLAAVTKNQYYLSIQGPAGSSVNGAGWYDSNTVPNATISYVWGTVGSSRFSLSSYQVDGGSKVAITRGELGNYSLPMKMNSPHTVVFSYATQYLVKVTSEYGSVTGSGWYDSNSTTPFSVSPSRVSAGFLTYYVFAGWSGDSTAKTDSASVVVDSPKTITANWSVDSTQLYIAVVGVVVLAAALSVGFWTRSRHSKPKGG